MAAKKKFAKRATKRVAKKAAAPPAPATVKLPVPSIGRIVLYSKNTTQEPAIITRGNDDPRGSISLMILGADGSSRAESVPYSDEPHHGCWSWPPFVPPKEVEA